MTFKKYPPIRLSSTIPKFHMVCLGCGSNLIYGMKTKAGITHISLSCYRKAKLGAKEYEKYMRELHD